ncbi:uroporphyrinogen-III synthase [Elizabethkingia meningoseptica]|uniref:uroporphyrinogen-III synthase n=1 Tax=Elizabethkingia meningoseptica TaxID=238 RepID=UPI0022F146EE|nr:uroporphyrinogen-III synthase [Elizabethkingia meningoseptica]EJK5328648.1 uroporphyrinogen-III synthase [Elizabethkingia meningoseptica]MDE5468438.1 uroporphyrinogen-III synthase [Elizabethkingia meningoseptica]MDE5475509.1 uroporphyrinogen-III synthase [Elizabethkingia meningoseptica]MDE5479385.1 uroporphyrinogen-III synthase [Elizabethkingia meningoseptica]MDE5485638.1 uroporphyrinogen-III synthase [Elizabethkingia meningoseptica]
MKARILFTKELSKEYIQQQLGDHFDPLFLPVISINPVKGDINTGDCKHFIFTSIQGVKAIKESVNFPSDAQFYVVGEKSQHALETLGYSVKIIAKNALELSDKIQCLNPVKIMHFCSSKALSTLRDKLTESGFDYIENIVYETLPLYPVQNTPADALVFFSPSGVESFMKNNTIVKEKLFAIGETTAKSLKSFTDKNIIKSEHETLEDLLRVIKDSYND